MHNDEHSNNDTTHMTEQDQTTCPYCKEHIEDCECKPSWHTDDVFNTDQRPGENENHLL